MTRLFFGIEVPGFVRESVWEQVQGLRSQGIEAGNWTRPDLYHITVLFLGELPAEPWLSRLHEVAGHAAERAQVFSLTLNHVGAFAKNRILYAGLEENRGTEVLTELANSLGQTLRCDLPNLDQRPYRPHLTLARKLRLNEDQGLFPDGLALGPMVNFEVAKLSLFASTRIDGRLAYPVIERFGFSPQSR